MTEQESDLLVTELSVSDGKYQLDFIANRLKEEFSPTLEVFRHKGYSFGISRLLPSDKIREVKDGICGIIDNLNE